MGNVRSPIAAPWVVLASLVVPACGFDELEPAPPEEDTYDDLDGAVTINGVQVSPAVIHPGDMVVLRDPLVPPPASPAPLYYWDACAGSIDQAEALGRQITWVAPAAAGTYAVTMNVTSAPRELPSVVVPLCVSPAGEDGCAAQIAGWPTLLSLAAAPDAFNQASDCAGACQTALLAEIEAMAADQLQYRWVSRRGMVAGTSAEASWQLPTVGCCTETFTAAITICDAGGGGDTGFTSVVVVPE